MKLIPVFLLLFFSVQLAAQQKVLLLSSGDKSAIPGAKLKFTCPGQADSGVLSDLSGWATLPDATGCTVKISAVGFHNLEQVIPAEWPDTLFLAPNTMLEEVCVTTQYQPGVASSTIQKIKVISTEQIQRSGAVTLSDVIQYQTGIRISQDNILGSSMSIGGISGENVKVLIDGVPVIGRLNGSLDLSQINLNTIERIEIIEGPLSVNYGTNALGGTINLITKKQDEKGLYFEVNPFYENTGNYNFNFNSGFRFKQGELSLSGGRNYFDGWSDNEKFISFPEEKLADTNRYLTWKPKEQYFGEVRFRTTLKGWQLTPYVRYFDEKITNRGFPKTPYYETAFDDYYYTWRKDGGVIVDKLFKKSRLNSIFAVNQFTRIKNTYLKDLTTLNEVLSETQGAQDTATFFLVNVRSVYNTLSSKKLNGEIGVDLNYESATGARIENGEQFMGDYAVFSTVEWQPVKNLVIKPGLRYAYNTVYQAPVIPSIHARFRAGEWTLRASVAKGFRAPSLKELYFDFVDINHNIHGNTELLAEHSMNYNLSAGWMKQTPENLLLKVDLGAYYNDIENLITLGLDGSNSYTYLNIGEYKTIGTQAGFSVRHKKINASVNAAWIGRYNALSDDTGLDAFTFSPEVSTQGSYSFFKERFCLSVFHKFNGPLQTFYFDADDELATSIQKSYQILDASLGVKALKNKLTITAGAKNILNVKTVAISAPGSGGTHTAGSGMNLARGVCFFVGIKYQFNFTFDKDAN